MAKTILFAYTKLFHPIFGGTERVTDILARELASRGYRVLYLYHNRIKEIPEYDFPAEVFNMPCESCDSVENDKFYEEFLAHEKVDVIIDQVAAFHDANQYLKLGVNRDIKRIATVHNDPYYNYHNLAEQMFHPIDKNRVVRWIKIAGRAILLPYIKWKYLHYFTTQYSYVGNNCELICLLSDSFRSSLSAIAPNIPEEKIVAIPNPNTYTEQVVDLSKKKRELLYVGRLLMNQKRPDRLLKIWSRIMDEFPDWEMVIVGDGEDREYLERKAKGLSRVRFEGRQDPKSYYESASIFCLTSSSEGFAMVLNEAMVHGVIPVTFDSFAAVGDIIEDNKNGLLITPFSIEEYAEKLRTLMRNQELRERMATRGMESVKKFNVKKIVDRWEELF